MLNIDAGVGKHGIFDHLSEFAHPAALADHLRLASKSNYGTPIRLFLQQLVNLENPLEAIKQHQLRFMQLHQKPSYLGQTQRVLARFALIYAAAELAREFDILAISAEEIQGAISTFFEQWANKQGGASIEANQIISQIRLYLQSYGMSRVPDIEDARQAQFHGSLAGFRKRDSEGNYEWLVLSEVFKSDVCKGLNLKLTCKILKEHGFLSTDGSGGGTSPLRIPQYGLARFYRISTRILD